jgi:thiosulfate reductase cytochrome b subunit
MTEASVLERVAVDELAAAPAHAYLVPNLLQITGFSATMLVVHRLFQFLLVVGQQLVNLVVRVVADRVNLRTQLLPRRCRIFIEQRLNPIVVLHKQRPNLSLLLRRQLQIFRQAGQFLVEGLRRMDALKLLTR